MTSFPFSILPKILKPDFVSSTFMGYSITGIDYTTF